jgi:hypothetical protein
VKKALRPIPGACAIGKLASRPINKDPTIAAIAVAVNTRSKSIPLSDRMAELTTRMYDIAKKVVIPARNSVPTEVLRSSNRKNLLTISIELSSPKNKIWRYLLFFFSK